MDEVKYSLNELAELAGVEIRTIRWYITEGLLRGPESLGRNAYYTDHHLKRLRTIRLLKENYGVSLRQIRRYLDIAGDEEDVEVVPVWLGSAAHEVVQRPAADMQLDAPTAPQDEVVCYSARVEDFAGPRRRQHSLRQRTAQAREPIPERTLLDQAPLENLLASLRETMSSREIPRQSSSEEMTRIDVTQDIALVIRGRRSPRELALLEQVADHLRVMLIGSDEQEGRE